MATAAEQYQNVLNRTYNSFTGADIHAVFGNQYTINLLSVTISETMEIAPIYTGGSRYARRFNRGKYAVGGSFTLAFTDRDPLLMDIFASTYGKTINDLYNPLSYGVGPNNTNQGSAGAGGAQYAYGIQLTTAQAKALQAVEYANAIADSNRARKIWSPMQLPPFDITVVWVDETGNASFCSILGVQIVNTGKGWSIDDLTSEQPYTYVAIRATPVVPYSSGGNMLSDTSTFMQTPTIGQLSGLV